ncbi:MAG TPA: hypothetical protein DDW53_18230 [Lachnoclostridium sp.]|nr:hypothetical protein [Lachnoclostridium sp.]
MLINLTELFTLEGKEKTYTPDLDMKVYHGPGGDYEVVDAEENAELATKFGIMQAPTLVVIKNDQIQKITNASDIRKFAESTIC